MKAATETIQNSIRRFITRKTASHLGGPIFEHDPLLTVCNGGDESHLHTLISVACGDCGEEKEEIELFENRRSFYISRQDAENNNLLCYCAWHGNVKLAAVMHSSPFPLPITRSPSPFPPRRN